MPPDLIAKQNTLVEKGESVVRVSAGLLDRKVNLVSPFVGAGDFREPRIQRRMKNQFASGDLRTVPGAHAPPPTSNDPATAMPDLRKSEMAESGKIVSQNADLFFIRQSYFENCSSGFPGPD